MKKKFKIGDILELTNTECDCCEDGEKVTVVKIENDGIRIQNGKFYLNSRLKMYNINWKKVLQ